MFQFFNKSFTALVEISDKNIGYIYILRTFKRQASNFGFATYVIFVVHGCCKAKLDF